MTPSPIIANAGLTAPRLYLRREPDPHDGRKQVLHLTLELARIQDVIGPLRKDVAALLENFDTHQLTAIAEFLTRTTDLIYRHAALLRAETNDLGGPCGQRDEAVRSD